MKCNNIYCTWQMCDVCCHEDEEMHNRVTPNQLDCPGVLRSDFEDEMIKCYNRVVDKVESMNFRQLRDLEKLIVKSQL